MARPPQLHSLQRLTSPIPLQVIVAIPLLAFAGTLSHPRLLQAQSTGAELQSVDDQPVDDQPVDDQPIQAQADSEQDSEQKTIRFSFDGTPWRDVLEWVADQNDLSFNLDYTPRGTLNFIDADRKYSPVEALDEINGQLLARGYTLVRRNRSLYIVDLQDELDQKFIRDLLDETPLEGLDQRGRFELTKVRFQLNAITAESAKEQIVQMVGPQGSIVTIPLARQLIVTETGENLRRIRSTIKIVEQQLGAEGLRAFPLKYATGDDVLAVAKPLLGIEQDANSAEDKSISISMDTQGKVVYATGTPDKMAIMKQVVTQVDAAAAAANNTKIIFKSHPVKRGDPEVVLRVVQTMLSTDPRVRIQAGVDNILAYATAQQHQDIETAITEIELAPTRVEVIPLRKYSPLTAVALVERIFVAEGDESPPVIDAMFDPDQLIVKGSEAQIDEIKQLLAGIGERIRAAGVKAVPDSRVLPIDESNFPEAVEMLRRMWPEVGNGNRIRILNQPDQPLIRVVPRDENSTDAETTVPETRETPEIESPNTTRYRQATSTLLVQRPQPNVREQLSDAPVNAPPADIVLSLTPDGLVVVSDDSAALDILEDLLLNVSAGASSQFHLFHLKHISADEAQTLLSSLFTSAGAMAAPGEERDTRGGVMGLMGTSGSSSIAPTMITDGRLNRIFVKGTAAQVRDVEQYLKVIDIEAGPVEVETNPKPAYIPVFFQNAESIVEILKNLYANRIVQPNNQSSRGRSPFGGFGGGDRGGQEATTGEAPKMTLAADTTSNLIIVSAPGPLLREVEQVIRELDTRAEAAPTEDYVVHRLSSGASPSVIKAALKGSYGDIIQTEGDGITAPEKSRSKSTTSNDNASANADAQRRAAFFQMMRGRSSEGGRGSTRGGGGSTRGGGGGGRGGRGGGGGR